MSAFRSSAAASPTRRTVDQAEGVEADAQTYIADLRLIENTIVNNITAAAGGRLGGGVEADARRGMT